MSRAPESSPLGKFDAEIPKLKVPHATRDILQEQAASVGMSLTEFVRFMCMVRAHGRSAVESMQARRLDAVVGKGDK